MPPNPTSQDSSSSSGLTAADNASGPSAQSTLGSHGHLGKVWNVADDHGRPESLSRPSGFNGGQEVGSRKERKANVFRPLLPAIGIRPGSHLPTPQSPNSRDTYVGSLAQEIESPIHKSRYKPPSFTPEDRSHTTISEQTMCAASLLTPDSTPLYARRSRSSLASTPPTTPPRTRLPDSDDDSIETPDTLPRAVSVPHTILSALSSPFVPELRLSAKSTPRRSREASPMLPPDSFSPPSTSSVATPPPLTAPIPQRAVGTEIQSIRLQFVADQAARFEETEARRPEYLKRTKRPSSSQSVDDKAGDQENTHPSLGVVDSPAKGRRLALFQETSEESFEQSLLAGGYPLYGRTPAYAELSLPVLNGKAGSLLPDGREINGPSTEEEMKKRRRLAAFQDHNSAETHAKLYPVTLEGLGRVLLDHLPLASTLNEHNPQKRRGGRKRKGPVLESPAKRILGSPGKRSTDLLHQNYETAKPNWPDDAFPWSLRTQQRVEYMQKEEEDRLRRIERYLECDSDEGEDSEDQSLGLPPVTEEVPNVRRGRGKMVPLASNPDGTSRNLSSKGMNVMIPSDPADARAALLSKRSIRALAFRRRQQQKRTVCICRGKDDGRELVQCDDCHQWFHLECIGIEDVSELGREEDPWYCNECLGIDRPAPSSPMFVPTDDRLPVNRKRGDLFFPGTVQESPPGITWDTPVRPPRTPTRESDLTHSLSSRSSHGSSQIGPHTPSASAYSCRVYNEPGPAPFLETLEEPFDPSSTPSRGMKFSGPFTTPKAPASWSYRGGMMQTPSRLLKKSSGTFPFAESYGASTPFRTVYSNNDESPVRRSIKSLPPHQPPGSPLASRAPAFPVFGSQASLSATTRGSSFEQLRAAGSVS